MFRKLIYFDCKARRGQHTPKSTDKMLCFLDLKPLEAMCLQANITTSYRFQTGRDKVEKFFVDENFRAKFKKMWTL